VAVPFVIDPVVPTFRTRYPRVEVEVAVDDRFVDIVAEGYDAGVRLSEAIERDMVQVRLTEPFRFVVVGSPDYLARHGIPERPEDLLRHECITFRSRTTGARGRRSTRSRRCERRWPCSARLQRGCMKSSPSVARCGPRARRHIVNRRTT
jgi:DNA-binding transcriptional LysR family regulator